MASLLGVNWAAAGAARKAFPSLTRSVCQLGTLQLLLHATCCWVCEEERTLLWGSCAAANPVRLGAVNDSHLCLALLSVAKLQFRDATKGLETAMSDTALTWCLQRWVEIHLG